MMTLEQIQAKRKELDEMEYRLTKLRNLDVIDRMLDGEHFLISITDATTTLIGAPMHINTLLTDHEQEVLAKSIQVVLEFARARMKEEMQQC